MNNEQIKILIIILGIVGFILITLIGVVIILHIKEKINENEEKQLERDKVGDKEIKKSEKGYTKETIFDFMEFEKIEDNMIIQKKGKFLMVIECQGINYDLMSDMEKVSVEQGFMEFLNSLRYPIQLHIQTRTVNLENCIEDYKQRLQEIEKKYEMTKNKYEQKLEVSNNTRELEKLKYELIKQKNLFDYTKDIIANTERTSLNKNVLSKKYYVIVPCYQSEMESGEFSKDEVREMAFSELYTRAKSIINSLYACQVSGKILDSEQLVELLYTEYNRDEADVFGMEKARRAGFTELYSTAPDVLDKKIKVLDKQIEEEALNLANSKIEEARNEKEIEIKNKEDNIDELIAELAESMIFENQDYLGEDVAESAINKIKEEKTTKKKLTKEGGKKDVQEKGKKGRPRTRNE